MNASGSDGPQRRGELHSHKTSPVVRRCSEPFASQLFTGKDSPFGGYARSMAPLDSLINSQGKSHNTPWQESPSMRILVAFEDTRFLYRDVLSREIHNSRPKLTVRSAALGKLEEELKSFVPDVVVCSQPIDVHIEPRARG